MQTYQDLNIPSWLKDSLKNMGYETLTKIQEDAIPLILEGKDILASAQTGTGKTAAFLVPLLSFLEDNRNKKALILTPTRELAHQVHEVASQMLKTNKFIKSALLIGGESIYTQFKQLKLRPRLIIGTPGRVSDHIDRGSVSVSNTGFVVLDETDRMLDMGFGVQIDEIFKHIEEVKQTVLFSATLPKGIQILAKKYLINPERVSVGELNQVATKVEQEAIQTQDKFKSLVEIVTNIPDTEAVIVFVRTKIAAEQIKDKLRDSGIKADCLHGGLKQSRRDQTVRAYKAKKFKVLVATDVASRGLDISHISQVVNYDLPENPEDYVHRIGRTARAEREGKATSFITNADKGKWRTIQRFIGAETGKSEDNTTEESYRNGNKRGGARSFSSNKRGGARPFARRDSSSNFNRNNKDGFDPLRGQSDQRSGDYSFRDRGANGSEFPSDNKRGNGGFGRDRRPFNRDSEGNRGNGDNRDRGSFNRDFDGNKSNFSHSQKRDGSPVRKSF